MRNKNKCQPFKPQTKQSETVLCVIGGGLDGTIAAISAARKGAKVVLIQGRSVLGGNCSSEIWMCVRGAKGYCNKETVILSELEEENIYRNPNLSPSLWYPVSRKRACRHPNRSARMCRKNVQPGANPAWKNRRIASYFWTKAA